MSAIYSYFKFQPLTNSRLVPIFSNWTARVLADHRLNCLLCYSVPGTILIEALHILGSFISNKHHQLRAQGSTLVRA